MDEDQGPRSTLWSRCCAADGRASLKMRITVENEVRYVRNAELGPGRHRNVSMPRTRKGRKAVHYTVQLHHCCNYLLLTSYSSGRSPRCFVAQHPFPWNIKNGLDRTSPCRATATDASLTTLGPGAIFLISTTSLKPPWANRMSGIVHVSGSARIISHPTT